MIKFAIVIALSILHSRSTPASCLPYGLTEKGFIDILRQKQLEEWTKSKEDEDEEIHLEV